MTPRTYSSQEEKSAPGFKVAISPEIVLLGGNAFDDFKLKPLLIHTAENP